MGFAKPYRWGWCGEGCPLEGSDVTWRTEETLTVTTHTVIMFDSDIYIMISVLVILALCLFSFKRKLERHGTHGRVLKKQNWLKIFLLVEKITRGIRKVIDFWQRRSENTEKEKEIVIGILATVLAVFIFLNMTCLVLVLKGYI